MPFHRQIRPAVHAAAGGGPQRAEGLVQARVVTISQMHVSRLLSRSLRYLRDRIAASGEDEETDQQ